MLLTEVKKWLFVAGNFAVLPYLVAIELFVCFLAFKDNQSF